MYEYTKLAPGQIRLLQIQPDVQDDLLQCSLVNIPLAEAKGVFDALSWTWGSDAITQSSMTVMVDGQHLNVGPNLWAMLNALRLRKITGAMWIDAICINQDKGNPQEKNEQIQMMAEIYETANQVAIWLGESADDSDYVLETLSIGDAEAYTTVRFAQGVFALLMRPWWTRTWTVQEFILNKREPKILCGQSHDISAEHLFAVFQSEEVDANVMSISRNHAAQMSLARIYWLYSIRQSRHRWNADRSYSRVNLSSVLGRLKLFQVTEPRDKVYAALGIITTADRAQFADDPGIHTERATLDVFLDATVYLLKSEKSSIVFYDFPVGKYNGLDAPSWVPNFDLHAARVLNSMVRLGDITSEHFDDAHEDVTISADRSTLLVCGRVLDRISKVIVTDDEIVPHLDWNLEDEVSRIRKMHTILHKIQRAVHELNAVDQVDWPCPEPLWKTLIAGVWGSISAPQLEDEPGCQQRFDELMAIPVDDPRNESSVMNNFESEPEILAMIMRTLTTRRSFFTGHGGYYGLSEPGAQHEDILALLFPDHFVPFILRPVERGYEMVGVAYVPKPMLESAIAAIKADRSTLESFTIV